MNIVTINVKDDQGGVVKSYKCELRVYETIQDLHEEARRVWCEYHVELVSGDTTLSTDYTYEQEMLLNAEHEQYKQFLMMNPV